jgi:hypothetical protein
MTKEIIIIECPNCKDFVIIDELNCMIFRHGVFIKDNKQINPHENKELCDKYIKENLIYGCGKPFKLIQQQEKYIAQKCDYI